MTQTELVNLFTATGRNAEAEKPCRDALVVYRELERADHGNPRRKLDLGRGCLSLGTLLLRTRRPAEGVKVFDEAVRLFGKLAADFPGIVENRHGLAVARMMRGNALSDINEPGRAADDYDAAAKLFAALVGTNRSVGEFVLGLAATEGNLALLRRDRGQLKEAQARLSRAIAAVKELLAVQPRHGPARSLFHKSLVDRVDVSGRLGQHADALKALDAALEGIGGPERGELLVLRTLTLARIGDHARAAAEAEKRTGPRTPPPTLYNLACVWSLCGVAVLADTRLPLAERLARAGACSANGFALLRQAARGGFFRSPAEQQLLRTDPDLALLRSQRAFEEILRSVEKK